jgi:hypothetical protein
MQATELLVNAAVRKLRNEANELVAIFTASQKTARANGRIADCRLSIAD